jgi:hypothetical protein
MLRTPYAPHNVAHSAWGRFARNPQDFLALCTKLLPGASPRLAAVEYDAAAARFGGERMPLDSAAHVASLLDALTVPPPVVVHGTFA